MSFLFCAPVLTGKRFRVFLQSLMCCSLCGVETLVLTRINWTALSDLLLCDMPVGRFYSQQ